MSTKIRLVRLGKKKVPFYRMIVADSRSARNGKAIDQVGTYNPALSDDAKLVLKNDLIKEWISRGAVLSQTVRELLEGKGLFELSVSPKTKPKKRKNRGNAMAVKVELRKEKEALEKKKLAALKKKEKEAATLASEAAKKAEEEKASAEAAVVAESAEAEKQEAPTVAEDKKE